MVQTPKKFTYSFKVVPAQVAKMQPSVTDADILADVTARHTIIDAEMAAIATAAAAKWC